MVDVAIFSTETPRPSPLPAGFYPPRDRIVVITVLVTLEAPNVFRHIVTAQAAAARSQIEILGAALTRTSLERRH